MNSCQSGYTQQLRLVRFAQLSDQNVQFTFMLPSNLVRGFVKELNSAIFTFANQNWCLRIVRSDLHIGAFLELIVPDNSTTNSNPENPEALIDLTLTVINLTHFSDNQTFSERRVLFNHDNKVRGSGCLIEASSLCEKNFVREDGCLLVELELANPMICYDLFLFPNYENYYESKFFLSGVEWKLTLFVAFKDHIILNLKSYSSKSSFLNLISFELLICPDVEIGRRIDLLLQGGEAEIELTGNISEMTALSFLKCFSQPTMSIRLRNVRHQKFHLLNLHRELMAEQSFIISIKGTDGFLWNVGFLRLNDRLYTRLMPKKTEKAIVKPDSIYTIGWNWCLLSQLEERVKSLANFYMCQKNFISYYGLQETNVIPTDIFKRKISQTNSKDEELNEHLDSTSPSVSYLQVSTLTSFQS